MSGARERVSPPRIAEWLARTAVPSRDRAEVLGDLLEAFECDRRRLGARAARTRYWRDAALLLSLRLPGLLPTPPRQPTPRRNSMSPPDRPSIRAAIFAARSRLLCRRSRHARDRDRRQSRGLQCRGPGLVEPVPASRGRAPGQPLQRQGGQAPSGLGLRRRRGLGAPRNGRLRRRCGPHRVELLPVVGQRFLGAGRRARFRRLLRCLGNLDVSWPGILGSAGRLAS